MSDEQRVEVIQEAIDSAREKGPDAERQAIQYLMVDPTQVTADRLWSYLVIGLVVLVGLALCGIIALLAAGKPTDIVLTAFTALLTGLLGLFIKAPGKQG